MDWTSIFGVILGFAVISYGLVESQSLGAFLSLHGILVVFGGTLASTMINTPAPLLFDAWRSLQFIFFRPRGMLPREAIRIVSTLAEKARTMGNLSIENDGQGIGDGFLQASIDACLSTSDENLASEILAQRVRQAKIRHTEVANVYRTMSILFPMFGLVGTLLGIVTVLKNISNPKNVGTAMAVALSTAFFGILTANFFCVPIAGKLRLRASEEALTHEVLAEGCLKIFFTGQLPSQIALYLESFLTERLTAAPAAPPPAPGAEGAPV